MEYILTFNNTNHAIKAEQCLLRHGLRVGVLPLPAQISAGCGISLRVCPDDIETALGALERNAVPEAVVFSRELKKGSYIYEERGTCDE